MENDYSLSALLAFTELLSAKGLANANTAGGFRVAATKTLVDLSDTEATDVRKIDVPRVILRLRNKNPNALSPSSLAEYQRRVQTLIREFVRFSENPTTYNGIGRGLGGAKKEAKEGPRKTAKSVSGSRHTRGNGGKGGSAAPADGLGLSYPLRTDFLAQIVVPRDLKADEAKRIGAFILTLAADYKP